MSKDRWLHRWFEKLLNRAWADPVGNTVTYAYDAAGRRTSTTIPLYVSGGTLVTATTTDAYDAAGERTAETNALNYTTTYSYGARGWLASQTSPLGDSTTYSYDAVGDQVNAYQNDGQGGQRVTTYAFDGAHRLIGETLPVAPATTYSYNADSQVTAVTGYNGGQGAFTYGYDAAGRRTSQSDALNDTTTYAYDAAGNLTQQTDPLNHVTTYTYDRRNEVLSVTNPLSGTTSYGYNLAGWRTSETDADSNLTQYGYNAAGQMTSETNPLSYQETFSYDAAGERTGQTDFAGRQTTYSYDLAGRRTGESWLNGQGQATYQATWGYDAAGELTSASDPNSSYAYSYDHDGNLTQQVVTYPGASSQPLVTLTSGYDGYGERTSLGDSLGGQVTYSFNGNAQLTAATLSVAGTAAKVTFAYDSQDRLSGTTGSVGGLASGSNVVSSDGYEGANRLTGLTYTSAPANTTLASFTYTYNAAGEVTASTGPDGTRTFSYDTTGQLTGVSGSQTANYSYDANGNRTMTGYHTGTGNELLNDGQYTYTYDQDGNLLTRTDASGNVWNYTWDYRDRLTEVKETNSSQQTVLDEVLTYDVNDNLIGVKLGGVQQRWTVFDGSGAYLDFTGSGQAGERYLKALGTHFARVSAAGAVDWYLTDSQGSVREIVSSGGVVEDQLTYDAYGNVVSETSPSSGDRFKYAGGEYDSNLGLYRFGERWYNAANGKWLSQDPSGLGPDSNPYRYVGNSPTDATDPSGLIPAVTISHDLAASILADSTVPIGSLDQAMAMFEQGGYLPTIISELTPGAHLGGAGPDLFQRASNFSAGMGDTISFGLTSRIRGGLGYDDVVDYHSGEYAGGEVAGTVVNTGLAFGNPCALGSGLGTGLRVINGVQAVGGTLNARDHIAEGNYFRAGLDTVGVVGNLGQVLRSCFTGDMLLDAEGGKKRADAVTVGDRLWARHESDPTGPLALKEVEEVFVRASPIWNLHLADQILRTTPEHPFYVQGRGWVPVSMLRTGDRLLTRSGRVARVQGVADSGGVATVYNWRVADYHTYFVSATAEGAAVWAHNAAYFDTNVNRWRDEETGRFISAAEAAAQSAPEGSAALEQIDSIRQAQQRIRRGTDGGRRIIDSIEGSEQTLRNQLRAPYDRADWE